MDLIHANGEKTEIGFVDDFVKFDAEISAEATVEKNRFDLTMDESVWAREPIECGHYLYVPGTEWGGPVEKIKHSTKTGQIVLSGPTWRGMLARKIVEPPSGASYLVLNHVEANAALLNLIGDKFGDFFEIDSATTGITISGEFRYAVLLAAIEAAFGASALAIACAYDNVARKARIGARQIEDYSSLVDLSQDYGIYLTSQEGGLESYNHAIALGRGELTDREVIHVYRLDNGTITTTDPGNRGERDLCTIYDYPNAESSEELLKGAKKLLRESVPARSVEMDTSETGLSLELGDKVSARDRLTGLVTVATVKGKTLVVTATEDKIQTKVG